MKKILFVCLMALTLLCAGCKKNDSGKKLSVSVTTNEVTNVSWSAFTLNGSVTYSSDGASHNIEMGMFYSDKAGVSATQNIDGTDPKVISYEGTNIYSRTVVNATVEGEVFTYEIQPGSTCYYVCYVNVDGKYTYGAEKSYVVPSR